MITDVFHPIADIWPLLDEAELAALADDIRANGLRLHIWRHRDGRIIDGRNRWLACQRVGFEPPSETYIGADGPELVRFVLSLNEKRRHLDASQRAMVADKIAPLVRGDNQHTAIAVTTQSEAADLLNVSVDSLQRARTVHREGAPELIDAVEQGRMAVSLAAQIARAPIERQREIIMSCDEKAIRQAAPRSCNRRARENAARNAEIATRQAIMPTIGYRCIVIDPPWPSDSTHRPCSGQHQLGLDYPTMSLDEIAAFKLPAADDCHLFCWTTQKLLADALRILDAWGFRYAVRSSGTRAAAFSRSDCRSSTASSSCTAARASRRSSRPRRSQPCLRAPGASTRASPTSSTT